MTQSEVYPNSPLALVVLEVRYPLTPGALDQPQLRPLGAALGKSLPLVDEVTDQQVKFDVTGGNLPTVTGQTRYRFSSRDRTMAATLSANRLTIESGSYNGYELFRPLVERVVKALERVVSPTGVERIGMRYMNEIRVSTIADDRSAKNPESWSPYLDNRLLTSPAFADVLDDLDYDGWLSIVRLSRGDRNHVNLRFGPGDRYAVGPEGPIKRRRLPPPGPFFLIDIDSYWQLGPSDEVPEFNSEMILEACDRLHTPTRALFETAISDELRDEVFRKKVTHGG